MSFEPRRWRNDRWSGAVAERSNAGVLDEAKELCRSRFPALTELLEPRAERSTPPPAALAPRRPVKLSPLAWMATVASGIATSGLVVARFHGRPDLLASRSGPRRDASVGDQYRGAPDSGLADVPVVSGGDRVLGAGGGAQEAFGGKSAILRKQGRTSR